MNGKDVLSIKMDANDSGAETIKGYLIALLDKLWEEGEGFSGKRPFGNSGWEFELYKPLVVAGAVVGNLDENGCLDDVDEVAANTLIFAAIAAL